MTEELKLILIRELQVLACRYELNELAFIVGTLSVEKESHVTVICSGGVDGPVSELVELMDCIVSTGKRDSEWGRDFNN